MRSSPVLRLLLSVAFALAGLAILPLGGAAGAQGTPSFDLISPSDGATIDTTDILVQINPINFTLNCAASGHADVAGQGQALVFVDGDTIAQLTNIYCTTSFIVPGNGLAPGEHTLAVVLASNTHVPMMDTAKAVKINYQPAQPLPLPVANYTGAPSVTLVSPKDGATVAPQFAVQVKPGNFAPQTGLEGKANVPGYGHYHVWIDTQEMPKSLAGLVLMPGTNAFTLDLSAWGEGKHTIRIETAQNDHTMYDPATSVTFTVDVSASATPTAATSSVASPVTVATTVATPTASPVTVATPAASPAASSGTVTIHMTNALRFEPPSVTIQKGQTVTWVNDSALPHSTTDDPAKNPVANQFPQYSQLPDGAPAWDSGLLQPGQSFSQTFTTAGTYDYFCIPHILSGMRGTITVQG